MQTIEAGSEIGGPHKMGGCPSRRSESLANRIKEGAAGLAALAEGLITRSATAGTISRASAWLCSLQRLLAHLRPGTPVAARTRTRCFIRLMHP
jgi:hypothetical protein